MKILILAPSPPNNFHRVRLTHIVSALKKDHKVDVLCQSTSNDSQYKNTYRSKIFKKNLINCYLNSLIRLPQQKPLEVTFCLDNSIKEYIQNIADSYDLIIIKRLRSLSFMPDSVDIPVIIDATDAMSLYYKRAYINAPLLKKPLFLEEFIKYRIFEYKVSDIYNNWVVCSKIDAKYLKQVLKSETQITVIPNVVDTEYYSSAKGSEKYSIMFSGLMEKYVNQSAINHFLRNIYPKVLDKYPCVKLYLVGPNPPNYLKRKSSKIFVVTGKVDDIRKYYERSKIIVVPTTVGVGTRNKVLQAWSHSRPVVSTKLGASGLKYQNGTNILVTDNPNNFSSYIIKLLEDDQLSKKLGRNGKKWVERNYSIETMREKYNDLIHKSQVK